MSPTRTHINTLKGFRLLENEPLSRHTSFRVGGPADILAMPKTRQELVGLIRAAGKEDVPVTLLGGGTNTLVSDKGIRGLTIVLTELKSKPVLLEETNNKFTLASDAGERLATLCRKAMDKGLTGLEFAAGIPGTLGGAVMMNAGAWEGNMAGVVSSVDVLDMDSLDSSTLKIKDLKFNYRSLALPGKILLGASLTLKKGDSKEIKDCFIKNLKAKKNTQPVSRASGGCFFKNPSPQTPAGKLIQEAGLKGKQHKGAMVSDIHANFIVNQDNASCADILALQGIIQSRVFDKFQIRLEPEVKVIGE